MKTIGLSIFILFLVSCTTQWNQRNGQKQKTGHWKETLYTQNGPLNATGKYRKGEKVGKWKFYYGSTKYEIDKHRGNKVKTTYYHPNGKIASQGKSQTVITGKNVDWKKTGIWKNFNPEGKVIETFNYKKENQEPIYDMQLLDSESMNKATDENLRRLMGLPIAKDTLKKGN